MKGYIKPVMRVVELSGQTLLTGSNEPAEEETVEFTFTTSTPSLWDREDVRVME